MGRFGRPTETEKLEASMPIEPDPMWPPGVEPTHLTKAQRADTELVAAFTEIAGPVWHCAKCGRITEQSMMDSRYCSSCYDLETQNTTLAQKMNSNWMETAKELGLNIFERQPEETDMEWLIWCKYRAYYPLKLPTWTALAAECRASVATVTKAAQKWSFRVRLIAWSRFTDASIQEERIVAIKEMNAKQLSMNQVLQAKLSDAIDMIQPELLKPNEIVSLFKITTELERKIITAVDEKVETDVTDRRAKQVSETKPEDLGAVLEVLQRTGLLDGKTIGIETTTRIVAKEVDDE